MSKGAKRKARPAATEEAKVTTTPAKGLKASQQHPEAEPQYVEEKRNLQDLWKAAFPVGTEWDQLDSVYKYNWDFSNLEKEFEQGGKFYGIGTANKVYILAATETSSSPSLPVLIPTLAAVVAPRPPSMEIGIRSVQREEEIVPMKHMKVDWIPYIPMELREGWNSERAAKKSGSNLPQIFVLGCTQRKASLKQMKEDRWMKFQYCVPYMCNPQNEEEKEQCTVVDILFPQEPQAPLCVQFDWDMDEVEDFTDELIEAEELSEDKKEAFMEFLKEEVKNAKKKKREARKKRMEDPKYQEAKTYYENIRLYKIYPVQTPNTPLIEKKARRINFYYGNADEII